MNARDENIQALTLVGLLLAVGMLAFYVLGIAFRGYSVPQLALAVVPVTLGLGLAGTGVYLTSRRAPAPAAAPSAPAGALVTVLEAEGVCPLGYTMRTGDSWVTHDSFEDVSDLCPRARKAVATYLGNLKAGRTPSQLPACLTKQHRAVFNVTWQAPAAEPVAAR